MEFLQWDKVVAAVMFAGMRIAGLMVYAPFLGSDSISLAVKAGLTLFLTALLYPAYSGALGGLGYGLLGHGVLGKPGGVDWVEVAGGEVVIGLLLGLTVQFVFEAA